MLRLFARVLGFAAFAAGMTAGVYDSARSIADGAFRLVSVAEAGSKLAPGPFAMLEAAARSLHPWLWDPLLLGALAAPAVIVMFLMGTALLLAGRPHRTFVAASR